MHLLENCRTAYNGRDGLEAQPSISTGFGASKVMSDGWAIAILVAAGSLTSGFLSFLLTRKGDIRPPRDCSMRRYTSSHEFVAVR